MCLIKSKGLFMQATYLLSIYLILNIIVAEKSFGTYKVKVHNYTQCKMAGMDKRPLTSNVTWVKQPNGTDSFYVSMTVRRFLGPFGIRLRVAKMDQATGQFQAVITYKMKDACTGLLGTEITALVPELSKNCTVAKGSMEFRLLDLDHFLHQLTGRSFYYGTYEFFTELTTIGVGSCMCNKLYAYYVPVTNRKV